MTFTDIEAAFSEPTEQELAKAKQDIAGPVPIVTEVPDTAVDLPRGIHSGGKWETRAEVRELNGSDEEALARFKDNADFIDGVVVYGTERIGSLDLSTKSFADRQSYLARLLLGEREQLFLAITKATFGDDKTLSYTCVCGLESELDLKLSRDFLAPEIDGLQSGAFSYVSSKGKSIEYRLVTGADQMEATARKGSSAADQNTLILSRCVSLVDGMEVLDPLSMARDLSMKDRLGILAAMAEKQPSPDMTLDFECPGCGRVTKLEVAWSDIFRP